MEGIFLKRGQYTYPLDEDVLWDFEPLAEVGDKVTAGSWLGKVEENHQPHKIMVPFVMTGEYTVKSIVPKGKYTIHQTIAVVEDHEGKETEITMVQKWPVKIPLTAYREKPRPYKLLETGVCIIDTLNPIVEGGTGFIPVLWNRENSVAACHFTSGGSRYRGDCSLWGTSQRGG